LGAKPARAPQIEREGGAGLLEKDPRRVPRKLAVRAEDENIASLAFI